MRMLSTRHTMNPFEDGHMRANTAEGLWGMFCFYRLLAYPHVMQTLTTGPVINFDVVERYYYFVTSTYWTGSSGLISCIQEKEACDDFLS